MTNMINADLQELEGILTLTMQEANRYLEGLTKRPVGASLPLAPSPLSLPTDGIGAKESLKLFRERFAGGLSGSPGPRYFGFVTGGVTPASLAGDWLVSVYDQNAFGSDESNAAWIELEAIGFLRELFGLSDAHHGSFVTGATMANFVGLAIGRQWVGRQAGVNIAQEGLQAAPPIKVLSASPHSSGFKALAMLGMGRGCLQKVPSLALREAIDVAELAKALEAWGEPCIVVANAGTVNTVDYDDLQAIAELGERFPFWLHVDAAFGGFAACSPHYEEHVAGLDRADSITIDAHKYLNVPYDAAMQFTRHIDLQMQVFLNSAIYLSKPSSPSNYVNLTPENSRRLRALPTWFTLIAYGKAGYRAIVEQTSRLAQQLAAKIDASEHFRLLAPVRLNGICFTLKLPEQELTLPLIRRYLELLKKDGRIFLTPTNYQNMSAIRISITNWRTQEADIEVAWQALQQALANLDSWGRE
jgi:glutamate/tyrosine decarboxylase-like PLP-dependent enzyme